MKLKRTGETAGDCEHGEIYTVSALLMDDKYLTEGVEFEELLSQYLLCEFEPAYKFEIGDEVIFSDLSSFKAKILSIDKDDYGIYYLVKIDKGRNGKSHLMLRAEETLSPAKKPDELVAGDEFKSRTGQKYKILHVGYDGYYKQKEYYCEVLNGPLKTMTRLVNTDSVDEIIYDDEVE